MCLDWDIDSSKKSIFVFEDKLFLLIQNTQNYIEEFSLLNELLPLANLNDSIIHVIYIIHEYNYIFVASKMKRNVKNEACSLHVSWNIFDIRVYFVFCCTQKNFFVSAFKTLKTHWLNHHMYISSYHADILTSYWKNGLIIYISQY